MLLGALGRSASHRRLLVVGGLALTLLVTVLSLHLAGAAAGSDATRCQKFRVQSQARAAMVSGSGERVVVIGDSWSAGLGLAQPARSWPSRLSGRVVVAGFSGSGFSEDASPCGRVSFADRAGNAVRRGAGLVVVEGGLNDYDQTDAAIEAGFARLMRVLAGHRVVVVGPADAPSRASQVVRVDELLARLSQRYGVAYVSTDDLRLPYLADRLHLTERGHQEFGAAVAQRISAVSA